MKRKKKSTILLVTIVFALSFIAAGCGGQSAAPAGTNGETGGKVYEMDVNNYFPSTHYFNTTILEPWKELVEEKTDGRVKVNLYHGSTLGKSTSVWEDLKGGVYDYSYMIAGYWYDTPMMKMTVSDLPFAIPDSTTGARIMEKFAAQYGEEVFADFKYMGIVTLPPYYLFSKEPIRSYEDIKGKRVRVYGKGAAEVIKSWGAIPVSVAYEDIYTSLEKGTIDVTIDHPLGVYGIKAYEVAPYVTPLGVTSLSLIHGLSLDFWNSLPDDLKTIFEEELFQDVVDLNIKSYEENTIDALNKYVEGGGEIFELSEEDKERFKSGGEESWNNWLAEANKRGYPGDEMMEYFRGLLREEGIELPY